MTTQIPETDKDITIEAFTDSIHNLPLGVQRVAYVGGHLVLAMACGEDGYHSGRRRYLVACVTCEVLLHEATTGTGERVAQHVKHPAASQTPKPKHVPPKEAVLAAMREAKESPCAKSQRGAVIYLRENTDRVTGLGSVRIVGRGHNGPPWTGSGVGSCDRTDGCKRDCNKRCVHAEARALRHAQLSPDDTKDYNLVHVKLGPVADGHVVTNLPMVTVAAGGGPSCWQCSREILDAGLAGVWLYEEVTSGGEWRYYTSKEFHETTLKACGIHPYPPNRQVEVACRRCIGTGIIETGNNDLPCDCQAGDLALFNTGHGMETGAQFKARRR